MFLINLKKLISRNIIILLKNLYQFLIKTKNILKNLKDLGRLSEDFKNTDILLALTKHENEDIRHYSVKNLAKLTDENLLKRYVDLLGFEKSSKNRREIASAIGRMRSKKAINTMIGLLDDDDPNVILQSIRGLLVFKGDKEIRKRILKLRRHENELVRKIIEVEFYDKKEYRKDHASCPDELKNLLAHGDAIKILKKVEDESVHLTFTSPPYYNARDYSIYKW